MTSSFKKSPNLVTLIMIDLMLELMSANLQQQMLLKLSD